MWFDESVIYQIYPLGFLGAPGENTYALGREDEEKETGHSILRIKDWAQHIRALGADCVLLNPIFESDVHGYDTRDYYTVDRRIGTNADFALVSRALHEAGLRVMLDGVFNHVGRGFWAFRDVQEKKWDSPYRDWFNINFDGNSPYNDGFWYEGWEGHYELVKLNLFNPAVVEHQFNAIRAWVEQFDIDALRLDVAYCLPPEYLRQLRAFTDSLKPDFILMGETLHGDYNRFMGTGQWAGGGAGGGRWNGNGGNNGGQAYSGTYGTTLCHSTTNYECYKGLYSSFNSMNMFEIGHSLARQFGPEQWTLYKGRHLLCFADNHDVSRVASILTNKEHLKPLYGMLFGMPGVPSVYYGSEWGLEGDKRDGDNALRPELASPETNSLTEWISRLAEVHKKSEAICYGSYRNALLTNKQIVFERVSEHEKVFVAVNADAASFRAHFDAGCGELTDLITGRKFSTEGGIELPPYSTMYLKAY
ncbi:MAG: alpha-amylase family glycosyl hydrolase [Eubacteriales bacterium]|nr:alpha-amylase family glycosyl hydrolase [Eubacteriales bacterium]